MSRRRGRTSGALTRRRLLFALGGASATGFGATALSTGAFSSVGASRTTNVSTADDPDALVGLLVNDTVKKNDQGLLVSIENNTVERIEFEVSLDDCSQGTLYGPNGSGCTVSLALDSGSSGDVDIEADVKDQTVSFGIIGSSSSFEFDATRETEAASGNTSGAVSIEKVNQYRAHADEDNWTIKDVEVNSENELDRVEYEVTDDNGDVRATRTDDASGTQYVRSGTGNDPAITVEPDDTDYPVQGGTTYELTVTAYDVGSNFDRVTRSDTA